MTPDLLFLIANVSVVPFWLLIIFLPGSAVTRWAVHSIAMPVLLGVAYLSIVISGAFNGGPEGAGFSSLEGVMALFTVKEAVLAGWLHYLAFDLFVGAWEARDGSRRAMPHLVLVPCLLLTLLLGPIGLLCYLVMRAVLGRGGWSLLER